MPKEAMTSDLRLPHSKKVIKWKPHGKWANLQFTQQTNNDK